MVLSPGPSSVTLEYHFNPPKLASTLCWRVSKMKMIKSASPGYCERYMKFQVHSTYYVSTECTPSVQEVLEPSTWNQVVAGIICKAVVLTLVVPEVPASCGRLCPYWPSPAPCPTDRPLPGQSPQKCPPQPGLLETSFLLEI